MSSRIQPESCFCLISYNYKWLSNIVVVRISLVQLRIRKTRAESIEHAMKILRKAIAFDPDIVCLPELWYPKAVDDFEYEFKPIIDLAKEQSIIIIAGAFLERIDTKQYISSPVISGTGETLGRQIKIHPFASQRAIATPGSTVKIFCCGGIKFGVAICYDLVFPEISRALVTKGAELIFYPSKISVKGIKPWHMYAQVRALENRIPVGAPNICDDGFGGKSTLVTFSYDKKTDIAIPKLMFGSVKEQTFGIDVDLEYVRKIRNQRMKDFRRALYPTL
jgi:omega-amidase